jgi:hypothetical protein
MVAVRGRHLTRGLACAVDGVPAAALLLSPSAALCRRSSLGLAALCLAVDHRLRLVVVHAKLPLANTTIARQLNRCGHRCRGRGSEGGASAGRCIEGGVSVGTSTSSSIALLDALRRTGRGGGGFR